MSNEELITALRKCGKANADRCWNCSYYDREPWCEAALANDAADALEAAEKRIAELEEEHNKTVTAIFQEEQLWWVNRCKELEAERMELTAKCRRLEARIPELEKDIIYWQTYAAEIER